MAQDANTNLIYFDKSNRSLYEIYPVLISPNWVNTSIHIYMYMHVHVYNIIIDRINFLLFEIV